MRAAAERVERAFHARQVQRRDLKVSGRVADGPVPEQHLNRPQILAGLEQVSGERVAECMHRHASAETHVGDRAVNSAPNGVWAQRLCAALSRKEQRAWWSHRTPVFAQRLEQPPR